MSLTNQHLGKVRHDPFGPSVQKWRHTFIQRSDLSNTHNTSFHSYEIALLQFSPVLCCKICTSGVDLFPAPETQRWSGRDTRGAHFLIALCAFSRCVSGAARER